MGFNSGFKRLIYSTLGQKSESVVAAVQTAKELRIHHSNSPVTSSDVRHYTDRVCQHATSMYTVYSIYTGTLEYKQLGREYVIIHWQRLSGDRIQMEARFSAHVQTGRTAYPTSYTMDTGSLSWG